MIIEVADIVLQHLGGSKGAGGCAQGALVALALGLGLIKLLKLGLSIDLFFWRQFLRPGKNLKEKYGAWAAVTGATDGIGRGYAEQLAKQGMNILLISRTQSKLDTVSAEIASTYGVETKTFEIDLVDAGNKSCAGPEWTALKSTLEALDVGVFINNAGQAPAPAYFHEDEPGEIDNAVAINCAAVVKCTYAMLPSMLARGRGAIVNISSAVGSLHASPIMTLYGSTKSFLDHFSRSLHAEYKSKGIDIQAVAPAFVSTNMTLNMPPSIDAPLPGPYARAAVRHIGYEDHAVPWFKHAMDRGMFHLPHEILTPLIKSQLLDIRAQILAQQAEADKEK